MAVAEVTNTKEALSTSGDGGRPYTNESVSIRLIDSSTDNNVHVVKRRRSFMEEASNDIMIQYHQDVVEKMTRNREVSERTRERKKWTMANELRKLTQGVNMKFDEASKIFTG